MGAIKNTKQKEEKHKLTDQEFAFVQMLNEMKSSYLQDMNHRMSAILNNIAKTRLGYEEKQDLQFEMDFGDEAHTLKVTKL